MKKIPAIISGFLIVSLPFIGKMWEVFSRYEAVFVSVTACSLILIAKRWKGRIFNLQISDILVVVYFLYGVLNIFLLMDFKIDSCIWWKWVAIFLGYIVIRSISHRYIILYFLTLAGLMQSIIAILQKIGVLSGNHLIFNITGTFYNPGQLGGFLAVAFLSAFCLFFGELKNNRSRKPIILSIYILSFVIIASALFLSDSRAAWFGVLGGIAVYFGAPIATFIKRYKTVSVLALIVVVSAISILFFQYKSGSTNGRLLIWRVCMDMVAQKPLLGHGVASFNQKYMLYQAEYFAQHTDSQFIMVADNVPHPYNEFLHVLVEQGILGLLILVGIFVVVLSHRSSDKIEQSFKGALITLIIYSVFSYPGYIFPILFLFPVLLGGLHSKKCHDIELRGATEIALKSLLIAVAVFGVYEITHYRKYSKKIDALFNSDHTEAKEFIADNYQQLKYNSAFNYLYANWMESYISEIPQQHIEGIDPFCEGYCTKGNYYLNKGDYALAEKYYKIASNMIPSRMMPNYLLWKLYVSQDNMQNSVHPHPPFVAIQYDILKVS